MKRPQMTHTMSSNVRSFGYDVGSAELWVAFRNTAGYYVYVNVPLLVHRGLIAAESKGNFMHEHVLDKYRVRHIAG